MNPTQKRDAESCRRATRDGMMQTISEQKARIAELEADAERMTEALRRKTEEATNLRQSTAELMRQRDARVREWMVRVEDMRYSKPGREGEWSRLLMKQLEDVLRAAAGQAILASPPPPDPEAAP